MTKHYYTIITSEIESFDKNCLGTGFIQIQENTFEKIMKQIRTEYRIQEVKQEGKDTIIICEGGTALAIRKSIPEDFIDVYYHRENYS